MATAMPHFLHGQLQAFATSWERDHEQAMACWELESRLKLATTLYELIAAAEQRRDSEVPAGDPARRVAHLNEFMGLYADWLRPAGEVLRAIDDLEAGGCTVQGAASFKSICSELQAVLRVPADRISRSLDDLEQGRCRPIGEVRDELRRRLGA